VSTVNWTLAATDHHN